MSIANNRFRQDSANNECGERMQEYFDRKLKEEKDELDRENREWILQLAAERMTKANRNPK